MDRGESQLVGEFESSDEEGISEPEVCVSTWCLYDASLYMSTFNNRRGTDSCYLLLKLMFVRDEKKKRVFCFSSGSQQSPQNQVRNGTCAQRLLSDGCNHVCPGDLSLIPAIRRNTLKRL